MEEQELTIAEMKKQIEHNQTQTSDFQKAVCTTIGDVDKKLSLQHQQNVSTHTMLVDHIERMQIGNTDVNNRINTLEKQISQVSSSLSSLSDSFHTLSTHHCVSDERNVKFQYDIMSKLESMIPLLAAKAEQPPNHYITASSSPATTTENSLTLFHQTPTKTPNDISIQADTPDQSTTPFYDMNNDSNSL